MTIRALVLAEAPTKLWGLSSSERLRRQLREIGGVAWQGGETGLPDSGQVLLLNGRFLFEIRTLRELLARPGSILTTTKTIRLAEGYITSRSLGPIDRKSVV